jgi:hypothetical protein
MVTQATALTTPAQTKAHHPDAFNPGSVLRPGHNGTEARILIETKNAERDFLMKVDLPDHDKALQAAMALDYCRHNGLDDEREMVLDALAAMCSVQARRAGMLLQGIVGVLLGEQNKQRNGFWGKRAAESNSEK